MSEMFVTDALKKLRKRSGLSMRKVSRALGKSNASSYRRYETPAIFTKKYLPLDLAEKLAAIFAGHGKPPIRAEEVLRLAGVGIARFRHKGAAVTVVNSVHGVQLRVDRVVTLDEARRILTVLRENGRENEFEIDKSLGL